MHLVAHRATLENVVTEQQSAVRKLEDKLSETEDLLRNVISASSKQQPASDKSSRVVQSFNIQQTQTETHDVHSSGDEVYSSGGDKRRRSVSADSRKPHLSPDIPRRMRHVDKSSRYRHHGGWMSDNDEHLSESDSSPSSESVLRRVINDLLSKECQSRRSSNRNKVVFCDYCDIQYNDPRITFILIKHLLGRTSCVKNKNYWMMFGGH